MSQSFELFKGVGQALVYQCFIGEKGYAMQPIHLGFIGKNLEKNTKKSLFVSCLIEEWGIVEEED